MTEQPFNIPCRAKLEQTALLSTGPSGPFCSSSIEPLEAECGNCEAQVTRYDNLVGAVGCNVSRYCEQAWSSLYPQAYVDEHNMPIADTLGCGACQNVLEFEVDDSGLRIAGQDACPIDAAGERIREHGLLEAGRIADRATAENESHLREQRFLEAEAVDPDECIGYTMEFEVRSGNSRPTADERLCLGASPAGNICFLPLRYNSKGQVMAVNGRSLEDWPQHCRLLLDTVTSDAQDDNTS